MLGCIVHAYAGTHYEAGEHAGGFPMSEELKSAGFWDSAICILL